MASARSLKSRESNPEDNRSSLFKFGSRLPLRFVLIVVLLSLQLVTLAAVLLTNRLKTEAILETHAEALMTDLAISITDNIEGFLTPAENSVRLSQSLIANGTLNVLDNNALEQYFLSQLENNPHLAGIYLGKQDGSFVYVMRNDEGYRTKIISTQAERETQLIYRDASLNETSREFDPTDTYTPLERPWFKQAKESQKLIWTEPYMFFSTKQPGITAALPVSTLESSELGVLGVDIEIAGLSSFVNSIPISRNGKAYIQTHNGIMVAFPDLEGILSNQESNALPTLSNLDSTMTTTLSIGNQSRTEGAFQRFEVEGEKHFGLHETLDLGKNLPWSLTVHAPASDFTGAIAANYRRGLWQMLAIGLLSCLLAIPIGFSITKPLMRLQERASFDALTGLLNREEFTLKAQALISKLNTNKNPAVLAMIDVDGFKPINDEFGHPVGDEVLKRLAERLSNAVKQDDLVGRMGGDEFILLLNNLSPHEAPQALQRIVEEVSHHPISSSVGNHVIGLTVGISNISKEQHIGISIKHADQALIKGKTIQKGSVYLNPAANLNPSSATL